MRKKILLIEDDQIVRENTAEILQLANYEVLTAENGKMGLEKANVFKPDLIICDILMPELDGYGVMQIAMRNEELQRIPIIFMSAKTKHEDIRKGMDLGASDYITKPFEESELLSAVATRLKRKAIMEGVHPNSVLRERKWRIEDIEEAFAHKERFEYRPGATIYCEGNVGNHVFYVTRGEVKTYKVNEDGKELITELFSDKSFFGFTSFLAHKPYSENAEAIQLTEIIKLEKIELLNLIKSNPQLGLNFIDLLSNDLDTVKDHLMHLAYDSVRKKTADAILQLAPQSTKDKTVRISRSDLASMIGIAKETLTRTLTDFKDEKLIRTNRNSIQVLNSQKLKNIH
jgi:CRP-like cAMP-binding protein/CheY-like chemotaxis protein